LEGCALLSNISAATVINYGANENVFVTDYDDDTVRYIYTADGTTWSPVNLGNPGVGVDKGPAVINYPVGNALYENVWVLGSIHNGEPNNPVRLYLDEFNGAKWNHWATNVPAPPSGVQLALSSPAVNNYQGGGGTLNEDVFVSATNGNVYDYSWNGSSWQWKNLGALANGVQVAAGSSPAVINYQARENVFVTGSDGNLYVGNGANWTGWKSLGNPGVLIASAPAAINYASGATLTENVFATSFDGRLFDYHWNGTSWKWLGAGFPGPGVHFPSGAPLAVTNVNGGVLGEFETVFGTTSDGHLWSYTWNGSSWRWAEDNPGGGVTLIGGPAVNIYQPMGGLEQMDVFVVGYPPPGQGQFPVDALYLRTSIGQWVVPSPTGW
jgi:hypothetical protein